MSEKISAMSSLSVASATKDDVLPIVNGGANYKISLQNLQSKLLSIPYLKGSGTDRYVTFADGISITTLALTINVLRAYAVYIYQAVTIDKIAIEFTAAVGGSVYIGVYDADSATGLPNNLIYSTPSISTAAPGAKIDTIASPITLQPGLYWIAYNTDTANTVRASSYIPINLGYGPTLGASFYATMVTKAHAFGALPSTFGAVTYSNVNSPLITFRIT